MKRKIHILFGLILFAMSLAACGGTKEKETEAESITAPAPERNEWEEKIAEELLSGETTLEKAMAEAVEFHVEETGDNQLQVTVKAPNIAEELIAWMEAVSEEEYSDEALEVEILRLLKEKEATETKVTVEYQALENEVILDYHREFSNVLTCGLVDFYMEMNRQMMEEMKEAES